MAQSLQTPSVSSQSGQFSGPVWVAPAKALRQLGPGPRDSTLAGFMINADVTEREEHRDQLYITEHPIESGAPISDHAYKRPAEVQLRVGWSNATHNDATFVTQVYQDLLRLQSERIPFDLYTGKRVYANMLLAGLIVETDAANEWALRVEAHLQQVFLVSTSVFAISSDPNDVSSPETALPTTDAGTRTLSPANNINTVSLANLGDLSSPSGADALTAGQTSAVQLSTVSTVPLAGPTDNQAQSPAATTAFGG